MTSAFFDRFDREDAADPGTNYTIPCGAAAIFDEKVIPIDVSVVPSGQSLPISGATRQKCQVLYTGESVDGPDYIVRGIWSHDDVAPSGVSDPPSFTVVARMTKDPILIDLGVAEDPDCYNQGYGLRVTCPINGSAPILKIVKYTPRSLPPNIIAGATAEPDNAVVLATRTLTANSMNLDPLWDETGQFPYRGFVQDMRLRIRRADNEVVLEAYLNDRNLNTPVLRYTDRRDPLWGAVGVPGFEFLSATLTTQPAGVSPYGLSGDPLMACHLFSVETIKDFRRPVTVAPANYFTYDRVTQRVITLVEKNGDSIYNSTTAGQTKFDTYLHFVLEAEADIIRTEGYWSWLYRESVILLEDDQNEYELPEDCGQIELIRLNNSTLPPLRELPSYLFRERLAGIDATSGRPQIFSLIEESVNNRKVIRVFPVPSVAANADPEPSLTVEYFARRLFPTEPDVQIPYVPQAHIDVLVYGAAYHALLLDTDMENAQAYGQRYAEKLATLRRENNRKGSTRQTVARSVADVRGLTSTARVPLTRATSLESLLVL